MYTKHALSRHREEHKAHNNACLTTLWFSKQVVCRDFHPVCIKHALGTQKLTNVLQRINKLITGSKADQRMVNPPPTVIRIAIHSRGQKVKFRQLGCIEIKVPGLPCKHSVCVEL